MCNNGGSDSHHVQWTLRSAEMADLRIDLISLFYVNSPCYFSYQGAYWKEGGIY